MVFPGRSKHKCGACGAQWLELWQKVESGEVGITLRTLAKLADVLSVEPGELLR